MAIGRLWTGAPHPSAGVRAAWPRAVRGGAVAVAVLVVAGLVTGCAPGEGTTPSTVTVHPTETVHPTADATQQPAIAGLVEIGDGRSMYLECAGAGSPTVILIGGLRAAADYWNRPGQAEPTVFESIAEQTRVCSYDRSGTVRAGNEFGRSDAVAQPSSEEQAVVDLHALLEAADVDGPYLLAAHSYGGFIARLYAGRYPDLVDGLVLIDALSEGFQDALTPEQFAAWEATTVVPPEDIEAYPGIERLDLPAVMGQIRRAAPLRDIPLTVVSADRLYAPLWQSMIDSGALPVGTPPGLGAEIDRAQVASQSYQAALVPDAVHVTQTASGHDVPLENPGMVTAAILGVFADVAARG